MAYARDTPMGYIVDISLKWIPRDKKKYTVTFIGPYTDVMFAVRAANIMVDPNVIQRCQEKAAAAASTGGKYKDTLDSKHKISLKILAGEHVKLKFNVSSKESGRNHFFPLMRSILCQHGWVSTGISDMEIRAVRHERERWAVPGKR